MDVMNIHRFTMNIHRFTMNIHRFTKSCFERYNMWIICIKYELYIMYVNICYHTHSAEVMWLFYCKPVILIIIIVECVLTP